MKKIVTGIFGGSFNPIHNGHIAIANAVCQSGLIQELWLMVSPQNPLKENKNLLDDAFRLNLAKIATREYSQIIVSDFEYHLPRPSYTFNTLQELTKVYPDREFVIIIGADNWENFSKWYKSESLLCLYRFIIYPRKGHSVDIKSLPDNIYYLDMPLYDISSTEIRRKLSNNESITGLVTNEVEKELKSFLSKQLHMRKCPPCDQ